MMKSIDLSQEIFAVGILTALKSSLKHRALTQTFSAMVTTIWRPGFRLLQELLAGESI